MSPKVPFASALLISAALLVPVPGSGGAQAAVIVVDPSNMGNWAFDNRDVNGIQGANPNSSGGMVVGPDTPPLGTGSANLAAGNGSIGGGGDGSEELRNTGYAGTLISQITTLMYSTYVTSNNGQQFPYFGLMVDTDGDTAYDDIFFFEPPYQTPSTGNPSLINQGDPILNTWQSWDALAGGWWDNNGNCGPGTGVDTLQACLGADYNTATIANAPDGLGGVRFNVGFASDTDIFNGYVDAFTIGINNVDTTYDFDPAAVTAVPEPMTISLFGGGLAAAAVMRRRRKVKKV